MKQQLQSVFSHSFETFCELGLLSWSGADAMMRCQFGHTRELLALGRDQAQRACSLPSDSEAWPAAISIAPQAAVETARQYAAQLSRWQAESWRLIEQQAAAANTIVDQAMAEALAELEGDAAARGARPSARSSKAEHRLAA